ncbi:dihydrofolate reductase-like domain-containing protein [Mycena olivaceomarginata]|nr:dihydrofolate reductase-like domain-containing protein [Mycena olivaceomarginata]
MTTVPEYLSSLLAPYRATEPPPTRPFVTLTFAQSLDGKIAGAEGKQLAISGHESLVMTHWLRSLHDAILVGSGTALNDDPQLNLRHLPPGAVGKPPRPIVLDSRLRLSPTCKLLRNYTNESGRGPQPWVVAYAPASPDAEWDIRREVLVRSGARVLVLPAGESPLTAVLALLRAEGVRSLMVEGGAQIISAFFAAASETRCVDTLLITTAPLIVGAAGVGYDVPGASPDLPQAFHVVETRLVGRDSVVAFQTT